MAKLSPGYRRVVVSVLAGLTLAFVGVGPALAGRVPSGRGAARWLVVHHGGTADLRAISPVSRDVVWASGSDGTVLRTTNGGASWQSVGPPGTSSLEFRGIKAFDAEHALLMAIGTKPDDFRIYLTSDGGRHWRITNENHNAQAFYDCMAFFNRRRGLVLSDPVNGKFRILLTADGGRTWRIDSPRNMPPSHFPNEYGFAASNECITTHGRSDAWFGSGGSDGARVFRSTDGGRVWRVARTPLARGADSGVFAVAFRTGLAGFAVGGNFAVPQRARRMLALTADGGRTWTLVGSPAAPDQYRSGGTWIPGTAGTAVVVGLTGTDISRDGGFSWQRFSGLSFDTVACTPAGSCWASGANEQIGRLLLR